jgi:hypothetical protein
MQDLARPIKQQQVDARWATKSWWAVGAGVLMNSAGWIVENGVHVRRQFYTLANLSQHTCRADEELPSW